MVVTFKEENLVTFKHLFLKNYADGDTDNYAVYRQADVYGYISHSIKQVAEHRLTWDAWCVCGPGQFSVLPLYSWKSLLQVYDPASIITGRPGTGL